MSGYSEAYREARHADFLRRWAPADKPLPELTQENLRHNIARANAAEARLREITSALAVLRGDGR